MSSSFDRSLPALALAAGLMMSASVGAMELITEDEGRLPAAPRVETRGGITRGPSVKIVSPAPDSLLRAPFNMKIDFQPHGGSKIDSSTVKVTYLTKPSVDLTPRLKSAISETGINAPEIHVPAGTHNLKVDVTDADGRTKSGVVTFTVVK